MKLNNLIYCPIKSQNKHFQPTMKKPDYSFGNVESVLAMKIEDEIRDKPEEIAVIIDPATDKELFRISGNRDNIHVPKSQIPFLKGKWVIHNHPNPRVRTLTRDDILSALDWGIKKITAVTPTESYTMTFPQAIGGLEFIKINAFDSFKNRKYFAHERNLPTSLDYSDIEIPETDEAWRHYMWTEMAKKFNWQYTYQQN